MMRTLLQIIARRSMLIAAVACTLILLFGVAPVQKENFHLAVRLKSSLSSMERLLCQGGQIPTPEWVRAARAARERLRDTYKKCSMFFQGRCPPPRNSAELSKECRAVLRDIGIQTPVRVDFHQPPSATKGIRLAATVEVSCGLGKLLEFLAHLANMPRAYRLRQIHVARPAGESGTSLAPHPPPVHGIIEIELLYVPR